MNPSDLLQVRQAIKTENSENFTNWICIRELILRSRGIIFLDVIRVGYIMDMRRQLHLRKTIYQLKLRKIMHPRVSIQGILERIEIKNGGR